MRHILALLALSLMSMMIAPSVQAQDGGGTDTTRTEQGPNLRIIARSYGDSIVLRWGTTTHTAWKVAGHGGYMIERYELRSSGTPERKMMTPSPIKPLTIDEWKARYRPEDTLAGAAVQALYGRPIVTTDDPFGSIYEMYLQQSTMFGFALALADMEPRLADGLGLRFVDKSVDRRRSYMYRIFSLAHNADERIDTAFVVIEGSDIRQTPSVESITAEEGEREIVLGWNRYEHIEPFTGYFIERSTDGGRTFARVNNMPYIPLDDPNNANDEDAGKITYKIKLQENYRPAQYRVVGIDAFGERSPQSKAITAMGRDRTAPHQPAMLPVEIVDGHSVKVSWRMDSLDADLKGFYVAKSEDVDASFDTLATLLPRDARTFVDQNVKDLPQHYYIVIAVDTAGNFRHSVPLLAMFPDSIPPAVPSGFTGVIDSNGIVTLRWNPSNEDDLQGYRVFYANQTDEEFQQLTTDITADTVFTDTLALMTLSEDIHYVITALDRNFNHSEFTPVLTLKKPDIVAPAAPLVTDVTSDTRGVTLAWSPSPTGDVMEHLLQRRIEGEERWEIITRVAPGAARSFTDTTARPGTQYEYSLEARDDAGHLSLRSNVITASITTAATLPTPAGVAHSIDREGRRIVVRWGAIPASSGRIYLYKASGTGALSLYQSLAPGATEFSDAEIFTGASYRYGVKVVTDAGSESSMAMTEMIEYN